MFTVKNHRLQYCAKSNYRNPGKTGEYAPRFSVGKGDIMTFADEHNTSLPTSELAIDKSIEEPLKKIKVKIYLKILDSLCNQLKIDVQRVRWLWFCRWNFFLMKEY